MNKVYLGVDIGGTNTALGLVSESGEIIARSKISTTAHSTAGNFIKSLHAEAQRLCCNVGCEITAVGVGAPCVNQDTGNIEGAVELRWGEIVPLRNLIEKRFGVKAYVTNDANAAAAGELKFGVARGLRNFIMLTLGTGVGSGIVCDGHLLGGAHGFAGELGHFITSEQEGRMCGCHRKDCLQTYASASGVVATARKMLAFPEFQSSLTSEMEVLTPEVIFQHAKAGDNLARKVFEFTGEVLGRAAANFATFTSPQAIILFGGVAGASEFIIPAMRNAMEHNILHIYRNKIQLFASILPGADAAILGAAALCNTLK